MKIWLIGFICSACLLAGPVAAGDPAAPGDLPPVDAVSQALDALPSVQAAQAEQRYARAEYKRMKAGAYEFNLSLAGQRRNVRGEANYKEWNVGLERGFRLPGKAGLDARAGEQGVLAATEKVADARHEGARQLLTIWYAARQARMEAGLWRKQVDLLTEQLRITEVRFKRGDSARLETFQAGAALSQAQAMAQAAESRERIALTELETRFPGIPMPDEVQAEPVMPPGDQAAWLANTLEHNHELMAARHELDKAKLLTRRAEADRLPDPTVGVYVANEQGGRDKIMGVSLTVALPGSARQSQARMQQAMADAMAERERAIRLRLTTESATNWQRARAGTEGWARQKDAAQAIGQHADLAKRAYELGELGLSDTLLARRAALDADMSAGQARLAGNEAVARLLLDAHRLWPLDRDEADH